MPITLYHGSKAGLDGPIRPISRDRCDFGSGFYLGTERLQPLTLICSYDKPCLYTVELDFDGLSVLDYSDGLDWALSIALNRGKLTRETAPALYDHIAQLSNGKDVITGKIANDRMFVVLDRFFAGAITDTALLACLSALDIGMH